MAKGTEDHVGFFAPQSKQIWIISVPTVLDSSSTCLTDLVGWLLLQLLEYLLRFCLGRQSHLGMKKRELGVY